MTIRSRIKILFLCTGNSCRSQMAEAFLRQLGRERFEPLSAGSHPAGFIHPLAIEAMDQLGISLTSQSSKSWNEFANTSVDAVITLCDSAAAEVCPVWPGSPLTVHWSIPDPVCLSGTHDERLAFAVQIAEKLRIRIAGLVNLDWSSGRAELKRQLETLGDI